MEERDEEDGEVLEGVGVSALSAIEDLGSDVALGNGVLGVRGGVGDLGGLAGIGDLCRESSASVFEKARWKDALMVANWRRPAGRLVSILESSTRVLPDAP